MADNCYCSVQFKTGEELDEALLKAKTACDEADKAVAARKAIENMGVQSYQLPPGSDPRVEKIVSEDGAVTISFGIPTAAEIDITTETWTFTLEDGSTVTKVVYVG